MLWVWRSKIEGKKEGKEVLVCLLSTKSAASVKSTLMLQLSSVDAAQSEASKAHLMSQKFKVRVAELEAQLQTLRDAMDKTMEEKTALEADMDILRAVNQQQRQQLTERSASVGEWELWCHCTRICAWVLRASVGEWELWYRCTRIRALVLSAWVGTWVSLDQDLCMGPETSVGEWELCCCWNSGIAGPASVHGSWVLLWVSGNCVFAGTLASLDQALYMGPECFCGWMGTVFLLELWHHWTRLCTWALSASVGEWEIWCCWTRTCAWVLILHLPPPPPWCIATDIVLSSAGWILFFL